MKEGGFSAAMSDRKYEDLPLCEGWFFVKS